MLELQKKMNLYCDLNDILAPHRYDEVVRIIEDNSGSDVLQHVVTYNTDDFLVQGLRDLAHAKIDDEAFFQIGDISIHRLMKQPRPHLTALQHIMEHIIPHTLYVVDEAAYIAYKHIYDDVSWFHHLLEKNRCIISVIVNS